MKAFVICALTLFAFAARAERIEDQGGVIEKLEMKSAKVGAVSLNKSQATVYLHTSCPKPPPSPKPPVPYRTEKGSHGCGQGLKVSLDVTQAEDKALYDLFLSASHVSLKAEKGEIVFVMAHKGCDCGGGCPCKPGPCPHHPHPVPPPHPVPDSNLDF